LRIMEDSRDATILDEWRSPIPIDVKLARLATSTREIPDRDRASKAQIAGSYFGVDFLKKIKRI
jgi:hypothetical protein